VKSTYELQQEQAQRRGESKPMPRPSLRPSDATNLAGTWRECSTCGGCHEDCPAGCDDGKVYGTGRQYLSHTRIGVLQACHRKYELTYEKRLERIDRVESLEMGKAFQKGVELRRPEAAGAEIMVRADEAPSTGDYDKLKIQAAIVMAACELYLTRWVPKCSHCQGTGMLERRYGDGLRQVEAEPCDMCEGTTYDLASEAREVEYLVQLRNPWTGHYSRTFDLKGYADGVVNFLRHPSPGRPDEALKLIENKLVGQISNVQIRKLVLDRQVTLACYGLWRATGLPVVEVHYRYVKKPQIRQRQGESVQQFCDRIITDYRSRPDFYSHEETLFRTTEDMLRVECELWIWSQQLRDLRRQRIYDRNVSSCDDYGGCQYLPICTGEPDHQSLYRVRERSDG
jgi:ferredoxin